MWISLQMSESVDRFTVALDKLIDYYIREYELSYTEIIGCVELLKARVVEEYLEEEAKEADG